MTEGCGPPPRVPYHRRYSVDPLQHQCLTNTRPNLLKGVLLLVVGHLQVFGKQVISEPEIGRRMEGSGREVASVVAVPGIARPSPLVVNRSGSRVVDPAVIGRPVVIMGGINVIRGPVPHVWAVDLGALPNNYFLFPISFENPRCPYPMKPKSGIDTSRQKALRHAEPTSRTARLGDRR